MFEDHDGNLSGTTKTLFSISHVLSNYWFLCIPCLLLMLTLYTKVIRKIKVSTLNVIELGFIALYVLLGFSIVIALFLPLIGGPIMIRGAAP